MDRRAIGVFDSGVGGLTVLKALHRRLPHEDLIYFGDTAHVPYGSKSKDAVTAFSLGIGRYLKARGVKLLVVACNTASALALSVLRRALKIPVVGVIEPGAREAAAATRNKRVGVIATEATIQSGAYQRELKALGLKPFGAACPLFVPLVEEGWWDRSVTAEIAKEYLKPLKRSRADTLILGCTHYPLIKPALRRAAGNSVRLIDSAEAVAMEVEELLTARGLAAGARRGRLEFVVSDGPERFLRLAVAFLGHRVTSVKIRRIDG